MRLRSLRRGCPVLGPQQFLLVFGKRRLQWVIDYGKHLYAAFLVCYGREPTLNELWELMERFVGYRVHGFTSYVVAAVIREARRTPDLVRRFYVEPLSHFTLQVAGRRQSEVVKGVVASGARDRL